jgi:D-alanyl-D-alanine dipeptidase
MKIKILISIYVFMFPFLLRAEAGKTSESNQTGDSQQLVLVITKDWNTVAGTLHRFERGETNSNWREVGAKFPIVMGRSGLAWGKGLHVLTNASGPVKHEGDGKSPAGIFRLSSAFGLAEPEKMSWVKLPYRHLSETIECVDDVKSVNYNSIVDRGQVKKMDWNSSEKMREIGEQYRLGVVVDHNTNPPENGDGSCVFIHIWKNAQTGTAGCTAMTSEKMEELLRWLDGKKNPVLVQLPEKEYQQLKGDWKLPGN